MSPEMEVDAEPLSMSKGELLANASRGGMSLGGSKVDGDGCSCRLASCKIFIY